MSELQWRKMECRLVFLLAVVLLQLAAATPKDIPCMKSLCTRTYKFKLRGIKCTSCIPEIEWLNEMTHHPLYSDEEMWFDKINVSALANHFQDVYSHEPDFYRDKLQSFTLTRYNWESNETADFSALSKFFNRLPKLKYLNISHNDFKTIDWCKDINGPNITTFNASNNKIYDMDIDTFKGMSQLTELILSNNELHELAPAYERLQKLQLLDMSNNRIYKLNNVLNKMPELRRVNLAGNKINHLLSTYFQGLRSLVELDISRNGFQFIRAETLQSLTSLSVLNLSENRLIERDLSLLLDSVRRLEVIDASRIGLWRVPATLTRSVKIMRLVGNQLTAINSGDFDSYPLLKFLDLSGNKLIMIEDDALGRLDNLEELNLYCNILSTVPKSLPSNLKILDLRQNAISTINVNDFHGLSTLKKLDLSGNVISNIENGAFRHLTSLDELDISDNPIKRLTSDALNGPQALRQLRMAGLTEFKLDENQNQDTAFPFSTPEFILELDLSRSSSLASLFLADNATLSACKKLHTLDLSNTNISSIRSDIPYVLPALYRINILGSEFNCSKWLQERLIITCEHEYVQYFIKDEKLKLSSKPSFQIVTTTQKATTMTLPSTASKTNSSSKSPIKHEFDMLVKPTATPPTTTATSYKYATTTDLPSPPTTTATTTTTTTIGTTQSEKIPGSTQPTTKMQVLEEESTTPSRVSVTNPSTTYSAEERPDLYTQRESKTSKPKVVNKKMPKETTPVEDNQNSETTTRLPSTAKLIPTNSYKKKMTTMKTTTTTSTMMTTTDENEISSTEEDDQPAIINLENDMTTTVYDENFKTSNHMFSEFSRSKVLLANDEEQVSAEELINDRSPRSSEFFSSGAHPGMLILVGAVIGAAAALTVVLSRRATARGREQYHRQENIALTPTTEQRW